MKKKRNVRIVIVVTSLLLAVTLMYTGILFTQTHSQTRQSGVYQLESVSGRLESNINDNENLTMELAIRAREYLSDKESLEKFIYAQKEEILAGDTEVFNLYIAGSDFCIIPDFDMPDDFLATERVWYTGAIKNNGKAYVSSPYLDAMTGEICYSVSVMLGDGDAVLGVDYTLESIRDYTAQMAGNAINAVIVTDEGIIAGCSDETMIGKKLVSMLPDYAGIYASAKARTDVVTGRIKSGFSHESLFASGTGNGWYLIVAISDWALYKNSYIQLFVTIGFSLVLFTVIILLYLSALKNREKAESALASREGVLSRITREFSEPLNRILERSGRENVSRMEDYEEEMAAIHSAGERLSELMGQVISYKSIAASSGKTERKQDTGRMGGMAGSFRTLILIVMIFVMILSLSANISSAYQWGNVRMAKEASEYDFQLSEWLNTQKSILDMFVSIVSVNPDMLSDYEEAVAYLNRITEQYPEISVTYMTNPDFEHTVYMNNGWEPEPGWHVEERQWYIDTLTSEEGWNISAPYYDEQTGGYCVTISEIVYDAKSGEFLGIFGIDFFMDKLVDILGDSYTDSGYAFLVDPKGEIINHPYGSYQMTQDQVTNIQTLAYGETRADGKTTQFFRDYDGAYKILIATRNRDSNFTVYVVSDAWVIYRNVIIYVLICSLASLFCIVFVYRLLTNMIRWQKETNRELEEAADAAIAAGRAKSSFLAQMSHEIRTPINAVLGMNEMILRESDNEEIRDYAENIRSAGRTLLSLINSILDFSKIEDGKMELVPVKYDVSSLINDLVNSISERARKKNLEFELRAEETLPCTLFGDDVRIRQVIMNLLTNAVKYTEKGKVTLTIRGKEKQDNRITLFVAVKDTGIGIRQEDMGKLFESFERLEETRNRNIEGTGLGMSIVIRLLAMMNSELRVDSTYGKGSEFSFEVVQEIVSDEPIGDFEEKLKKSIERSEEERYLVASGARILVVDDNEMNLKVAKSLMKRSGIVPDQASSGAEAIEMMTAMKYDIVFLDHMMPKMDGIETLKRLKADNLIPEGCVIIVLTANAVSGARERYLEEGFDDYLSKPIEVVQLEKKLSKWLPAELTRWETLPAKAPEPAETASEPAAIESDAEPAAMVSDAEPEVMEFDAALEEEDDGIFEFAPDDDDGIFEFAVDEDSEDTIPAAKDEPDLDTMLQKLKDAGFETKAALGFCGEDPEFYREILSDYAESCPKKKRELDECFAAEDWHEFEVKIHALKSTSKTIGAAALSGRALSLEKASGKKDADYIRENYPEFAAQYTEIVQTVKRALGMQQ